MGNRLSLAKKYLEKIEHHFNHSGSGGWEQALHASSKISEYRKNSGASGSDAFELSEIAKKANAMMAEMKKRRDEFMAENERKSTEKEPAKIPMKKAGSPMLGKCNVQIDGVCSLELDGPVQGYINKNTEEYIFVCSSCSKIMFDAKEWVDYKFNING